MQIPSLPLFANINENEWNYLREHNMLKLSSYAKNNIIFHMDELIDEIGIVISGIVTIESIDLWGNKSILSNIACGHVFAETYCFCREPLQVEVISASNTEILFLNISRLFTQSDNNNIAKTLSQKITGNMLTISMHKNLILSNRIFCTSPKTVRSRLLIFYQMNQEEPADLILQYIMTANSSPIILMLTALHSPKNLVKCVTMV